MSTILVDIIAGARPNFMKIAPIIHAIQAREKQGGPIRYRLVHTGQHWGARVPLAAHQGQVHVSGVGLLKGMGLKHTVGRVQGAATDFADQCLRFAAVFDQVGDGANFQAMLGCKQLQIGQAGHGAVVLHDFANHAAGVATGHAGQVASGFGVARAHQHAAIHRLQGKHMAGLHQVLGAAVGGHRDLHGARPVGCRYARGDALGGLDGYGEGGAVGGAVAQGHGWQAQELAALAGEGQADQAPAKAGHEVDGIGRDMV